MRGWVGWTAAALAAAIGTGAGAQTASDIPKSFKPADAGFRYERRVAEIAMRDGVKLHTVLLVPKGLKDAPILLERTPYGADAAIKDGGPDPEQLVAPWRAELVRAGYILAVQDVRGKHGSQGIYINERPLRGPLNPTRTDHATDAWDTVDWLVKHVPEGNGRVGMIGTSYDGMMVAMALTDPHPALKAAVPANPVINTYKGDDDFHGGATRIAGYDYYYEQDAAKGSAGDLWRTTYDDYDEFLRAGSASDFVHARGLEQLPIVQRLHDHPTYDSYWQAQALEDILPRHAPTVPTLWIAGQWDQEDIYGAVAAFEALAPVDPQGLNHLVLGPWRHGGWVGDGATLGPIRFDADTALQFRRDTLLPFLDANLKTNGAPAALPRVLAFQTGTNRWQRLDRWPAAPTTQRWWFAADAALAPAAPAAAGADSYVSDPKKPVPYRLRPIRPTYASGSTWGQWLVDDQRPFSDRPDVLAYTSAPLTAPVAIAGAAAVSLVASTTGTDGDFVAKLIDVYPDQYAADPKLSGYQLAVAMDVLRGRYRDSLSEPKAIPAGQPTVFRIVLPNANHVFLPGHRIMVQVQSSWFPLYDRNPQTFVANIFDAKPADYRAATVSVRWGGQGSYVELPVVPTP
ncbi:CocE/NonD family hydrolase [uncultured Sphingomonas sp.]|uniref:CocE/NonD family hydrolase n=1 Tax=uncultured Sphingomonas sp. TaxID=158754 RepID=UPI0035C9B832